MRQPCRLYQVAATRDTTLLTHSASLTYLPKDDIPEIMFYTISWITLACQVKAISRSMEKKSSPRRAERFYDHGHELYWAWLQVGARWGYACGVVLQAALFKQAEGQTMKETI